VLRGVPARHISRAAAFAVLTMVATTAASAQPSPPRKALHPPSKCISAPPTHNGRSILRELQRLGVRVWSGGLSWATIAPTRPTNPTDPDDPAYQWPATLDAFLTAARKAGIEPLLYVNGFPAWSNGGRDSSWAPRAPRDYADFMAAAVRRYPQVRRWVVFSEPGNYVNFKPQGEQGRRAPRLYARLLDAAYGSMHAVRPNVVVIGGNLHPAGLNDETTTAPDTFITNMVLPNGRRPRLDMFGINPYTERPLNLALPHRRLRVDFDDMDWLSRRLHKLWPARHLKIFIDEFGWNTEHAAQGWLYYVSRKKQALNLTKAYALAAKVGAIDTMCWFQLYDDPPQKRGQYWWNWTSGLRTWNGVRKTAWRAFARLPSGPSRLADASR
jgi:hypothetical protein